MQKREWSSPALVVYGDMAELTRQSDRGLDARDCGRNGPRPCKPKAVGFGDDFATSISTV